MEDLYGTGRPQVFLDVHQIVEARGGLFQATYSRRSRSSSPFCQASRSNVISTASGSLNPACDNVFAVIRVYPTCNETQWTPDRVLSFACYDRPPSHFCETWPVSNLSGYIDADDLSSELGEHGGKNEINELKSLWFIVKYCYVEWCVIANGRKNAFLLEIMGWIPCNDQD